MILVGIWCLTTAIAVASVLSAEQTSVQRRILPWSGGLLVGIAVFWVLPAIAEDEGWLPSLAGVVAVLLFLGLVDRYIYPICPFCAAGVHTHGASESAAAHEHVISLAWPLLVIGCLHSFFDGWTIGLAHSPGLSNAAAALSWGATIHKIPESMAVGFLAARLTHTRRMALATAALVQAAMAAGILLAVAAGTLDNRWANWSAIAACGFLLLLGLVALQQEWRSHGKLAAMRTVAPGLAGCAILALVSHVLGR